MAKTVSTSLRSLKAKSRQRRQRKKRQQWLAIGVIILSIILLGVWAFWMFADNPTQASIRYSFEDISYDTPLRAIHEMEPFNFASIPFLPKGGPQPSIAASETFYNFGRIGPADIVTQEFVIANQGDETLTISRAYTTCGCTTVDFTATVIPPGKVSIMTLTLDAGYHDVRGQTVKRGVFIENNDPNNPEFEIWTQASVRTN